MSFFDVFAVGRCGFVAGDGCIEVAFDFLVRGALVAFEGEDVFGVGFLDFSGDPALPFGQRLRFFAISLRSVRLHSPAKAKHIRVAANLYQLLDNHVRVRRLGLVSNENWALRRRSSG